MNVQDQLHRTINFDATPRRIISLVPSQTELLAYLQLDEAVVGITKFCTRPARWRTKTKIGGTKNLNLTLIRKLAPDLILANKEENNKDAIETLAGEFPVWISDVNHLSDACQMIERVGTLTNKAEAAGRLNNEIMAAFKSLKPAVDPNAPVSGSGSSAHKDRVAYLIWKEPYMTVGGDTFISCMLTEAGFKNIFANKLRYPVTTIEELQALQCKLIFLSSEPYPFNQTHADYIKQLLPEARVLLVDGEAFSWYGSRLLEVPPYFRSLHSKLEAMSYIR